MKAFGLVIAAFLAATASAVAADGNEDTDVPRGCQFVCQLVTSTAETCSSAFDSDSSEYTSCVCDASSMNSILPLCQACVFAIAPEEEDEG